MTRADRVIAIEIDPGLVELLRAEVHRPKPVLRWCTPTRSRPISASGAPRSLRGNLPYYAATPIIEKTLETAFRRAVFLVQKEVAARLTARPGTRDYGYLSVQTQLFADVEALFDVAPSAFRPPPKVYSTLVRLLPQHRAAELGIADAGRFLAFVAQCFRHKRKTIRNNLAGTFGKNAVAPDPEAGRRAEQLTLEQFADLYRRLVPS